MTQIDIFDLRGFLPYLLAQAAEEASLGFAQVYKEKYGLLRTEWRVLFHLGIYGEMTATGIGAKAKLHKTKISRAVQRLVERRFVTRERLDSDRRQEILRLTPAGMRAYRDLNAVAQQYEQKLLAGFSDGEIDVLRSTLKRLANLG
ncbi:MarR family winged helix-turn-helix transcriptional regulator [Shimia biformata]|uniref:MarR family winged helix-turn-helix transcriptional regulator n=1 Tax=Shimia biformata TaxID=1294299 RepID=UPI00195043E8|nr:MarR family transcriptional regulator [Shimia biformata]